MCRTWSPQYQLTIHMFQIFGIDNLSHEIIWQLMLEDVLPFSSIGKDHVPLFIQRTTRHYPYPALCTVLYRHKVSASAFFLNNSQLVSLVLKLYTHKMNPVSSLKMCLNFKDCSIFS